MKHQELAAPAGRIFPSIRPAQLLGLLFGLVLLGLLALPAHAADPVDPPDRVGRLSELNGQVWIYATDSNEWIEAARNRPVTSGDRISTESDGRAEVRIGSTVLRIAPNTELEVQELDDSRVGLRLHSGSATARLRTREAASEFSLATEEGRFRANGTGNFRFDRVDDTTSATALSGQVTYEHEGTALTVQQGQRAEFWKERGVAQYTLSDPRRDAFGDWVAQRDSGEERSVSTRYVSPEMTGVEDLDRYGRWEQTTEYGPIWTPRQVAPGWAPYRMGHWAWVHPWGWTWVDDAPWGFAPFHYGRWVYHRSAWCWTPGRYAARPVYAPALVAWVGGPNVSVSVSVGGAPNVGWFPLGPREVYVPGYRVSPRYVRNVNVTHVTNITNITSTTIVNNPARFMAGTHYVNRGLPQAVTVVPAGVVERRQPVAPAFRPVNDRLLRDMNRDRPRAEAPVVAPPRWAPGARQVTDPRVSRPGEINRPGAPGRPSREVGNGPPPVAATPAPMPRPQLPPSRDSRDPRGRDNPPPAGNNAPVWSPRDGGNDSRGNRPPQQGEAPPRMVQPTQPQPPSAGRIGSGQENVGRDRQPLPPVQQPPQQTPPPRVTAPDRALAPPAQDERRRRHEMPGPPPRAVQAPAPAPQPQVQVQPPAQVAPPPVMVRPPAPVVRPPPVVQQRQPEAPREARPQPEERQPRGREERERSNDRPDRGERGERR